MRPVGTVRAVRGIDVYGIGGVQSVHEYGRLRVAAWLPGCVGERQLVGLSKSSAGDRQEGDVADQNLPTIKQTHEALLA